MKVLKGTRHRRIFKIGDRMKSPVDESSYFLLESKSNLRKLRKGNLGDVTSKKNVEMHWNQNAPIAASAQPRHIIAFHSVTVAK